MYLMSMATGGEKFKKLRQQYKVPVEELTSLLGYSHRSGVQALENSKRDYLPYKKIEKSLSLFEKYGADREEVLAIAGANTSSYLEAVQIANSPNYQQINHDSKSKNNFRLKSICRSYGFITWKDQENCAINLGRISQTPTN